MTSVRYSRPSEVVAVSASIYSDKTGFLITCTILTITFLLPQSFLTRQMHTASRGEPENACMQLYGHVHGNRTINVRNNVSSSKNILTVRRCGRFLVTMIRMQTLHVFERLTDRLIVPR